MLTAVIVLAAVGGALAFKAKTFGSTIYCNIPSDDFCKYAKDGYEIGGTQNAAHCVATPQEAPCPAVFTRLKA